MVSCPLQPPRMFNLRNIMMGGEDRRVSGLRMSDPESPELPIEISETDWEGDGEQNMG